MAISESKSEWQNVCQQKAESRERKAETELKAKHAKHDACQKLQVASCALSHAPQSPTSPWLLTVCSCICQCMCLRVRVRVRVCAECVCCWCNYLTFHNSSN